MGIEIQDTFHLPKEKLAEMGVKTVDTIHPDLVEFRRKLDVLFEKAEPLRQYQQLCAEIREDAKKLAEKMRSRIKDHPEMCDSNCPESDYCSQQVNGECPVIKHDYVGLWYGYNSFYELKRLVPGLDSL